MQKTAKLWVNHLSMSGDPSAHVSYLTNGHQLHTDEHAKVWTKSIPKGCKIDRAALVKHWRGIHEKFLEERRTPGSSVHHNARVTARQFVINLPNDISDEQVNQLAKRVLQDFPCHIPVSMVLHRKSNRGQKHLHLQGLFSYRNGGYGAIQEDFRMNITGQMKTTVTEELSRQGYLVDHGNPGSINTKERRWLNQQGTVEQRRNPRFMTALASIAKSPRLKSYCGKQAQKMLARISALPPVELTMDLMLNMTELPSIYPREANTPQGTTCTSRPRGPMGPLTDALLKKSLIRARRWNITKKISKSI